MELGIRVTAFGRTSLTMRAEVRNMVTRARILAIEIVFVSLDEDGTPQPHGYTTSATTGIGFPAASAPANGGVATP